MNTHFDLPLNKRSVIEKGNQRLNLIVRFKIWLLRKLDFPFNEMASTITEILFNVDSLL